MDRRLVVRLTQDEVREAQDVGNARFYEALRQGRRPVAGMDERDAYWSHINGAIGEQAFSKWSGIPWQKSVNTYREGGDVGLAQVRTRSRHGYDLIIRPRDDHDDAGYVLVTGTPPEYWIRGWLYCGEAKQARYWKTYGDREPAWFVPAADLRPLLRASGAPRPRPVLRVVA